VGLGAWEERGQLSVGWRIDRVVCRESLGTGKAEEEEEKEEEEAEEEARGKMVGSKADGMGWNEQGSAGEQHQGLYSTPYAYSCS
jgi:hypothetical protein